MFFREEITIDCVSELYVQNAAEDSGWSLEVKKENLPIAREIVFLKYLYLHANIKSGCMPCSIGCDIEQQLVSAILIDIVLLAIIVVHIYLLKNKINWVYGRDVKFW